MRTAIWTLGVVAAAVVGACFDPTRTCNTDADCVNGSCDPGTKTCIAGGNPNDKTPPVFVLAMSAPPARQNTLKLTELDPDSPDGGVDAFRRNESLTVTLTSADTDVDAGSVRLRVFGVSSTPGAPPVDAQLVACPLGSPASGSPFCAQATVALAAVPFDAFRGMVTLEASGSDLSSNRGTADAGVNVTRWRWRYSAGAPIFTTPAIADDGTVVFGTADGGSGSLYALTPEGSEKWAPIAVGQVKASPVIGGIDGGQQLAYLGISATGGRLLAFDLRDGGEVAVCPSTGVYEGPFVGTPALVLSGSRSYEGALALANGSKLVNIRPGASVADGTCLVSDATGSQSFPSSVVANGADSFVGTIEGLVWSYKLLSGNWVANTNWGGGLGYSPVGSRGVAGLALTSRLIGTTSARGAFELDGSDGTLRGNFPDGGVASDPGGPIVTSSEILFGAASSTAPTLFAAELDLSTGTAAPLAQALTGSPLLGIDAWIYVATVGGTVEARTGGSQVSWSSSLGSSESFLASPTIGCPLPSNKGQLYLGSTSGNLFSILVDSARLDPTAPWPKYQHDVRNTGNPTTPIQSCP
jgi:hypothetical protein